MAKRATGRTRRGRAGSLLWEALESRLLLSTWIHLTLQPRALQTYTPNYELSALPDSKTASAADGYTPAQIRTAYAMNGISFGDVTGDGTGQTIAIIDAFNDPTIQADLRTFDATFGIADTTLTVEGQTGSTTSLPRTDPAGRGNSWAVETSLDVEWAHAVAPGAKILLIEASSDSDSDLNVAVATARAATGVSVVTMSFGSAESSSDPAGNGDYTTPAGHIGETFLASAGDNGAYGDGGIVKAAEYPAASPNVVAVGGTNLVTEDDGTYLSESGWGDGTTSGDDGGGGGGISKYETQPAYQKGIVTQSTTKRTVPDVSIDADPNSGVDVVDTYDSPTSPWMVVGGTSLAAPMWAGVIAIADQGRVLAGEGTMDGATQTLPGIYALPSGDFHDVTTGNNGFAAGTWYDLVTGLGTPIVNLVVSDLAGDTAITPPPTTPTQAVVPTIGSFAVSPTLVVSGATLTLTAKGVAEVGGTISSVLFYRETNGTSGLQTTADTLIGTGTESGTTWTIKTSTSGLGGGSYTYYAVAVDASGVSSAASVAVATVAAPTISLSAIPTGVVSGTSFTLSAKGVAEAGGTVASVVFYRESNGVSGFQAGADTVVGTGTKSGTTWSIAASTAGLTAGTYTYYAVATDKVGVQTVASTVVTVTAPSMLLNDNFANATLLTGMSISVTGSTVGATHEAHEPFIERSGGKSVWYSWKAPASGTVTLTTVGSDFDTLLGVYKGTAVAKLSLVTANDDASFFELTSAVTFKAVAGTTYHFAVDGYNGAAGDVVLNLWEAVPAAKKKK
jgi:subtilase family serine protease